MDDPCVNGQAKPGSAGEWGSSMTPVNANLVRAYHTRQWSRRQSNRLMCRWVVPGFTGAIRDAEQAFAPASVQEPGPSRRPRRPEASAQSAEVQVGSGVPG